MLQNVAVGDLSIPACRMVATRVCDMTTYTADPALAIDHNGQTYQFCSRRRRERFGPIGASR